LTFDLDAVIKKKDDYC